MNSLFPEPVVAKQKTSRGLLPWKSVPPHTLPERWATIADLEKLLNDPSIDWSDAHRFVATSCYVMSGSELDRIIRGLIVMLRGETR